MPTQLEVEIARNEARRYDQLSVELAVERNKHEPGFVLGESDYAALNGALDIIRRRQMRASDEYRRVLDAHNAEKLATDLALTRRQREILLEVSLGATLDSMYLSFHTSKTSPHRSSEAVDYRRTIKPLVACGYLTPVNNERGYLAARQYPNGARAHQLSRPFCARDMC
jgi:hypothetical protein